MAAGRLMKISGSSNMTGKPRNLHVNIDHDAIGVNNFFVWVPNSNRERTSSISASLQRKVRT